MSKSLKDILKDNGYEKPKDDLWEGPAWEDRRIETPPPRRMTINEVIGKFGDGLESAGNGCAPILLFMILIFVLGGCL